MSVGGTYHIEFGQGVAQVVTRGSIAYGVRANPESAWVRAGSDREWLREQEEFLQLSAQADRESIADIDQ